MNFRRTWIFFSLFLSVLALNSPIAQSADRADSRNLKDWLYWRQLNFLNAEVYSFFSREKRILKLAYISGINQKTSGSPAQTGNNSKAAPWILVPDYGRPDDPAFISSLKSLLKDRNLFVFFPQEHFLGKNLYSRPYRGRYDSKIFQLELRDARYLAGQISMLDHSPPPEKIIVGGVFSSLLL